MNEIAGRKTIELTERGAPAVISQAEWSSSEFEPVALRPELRQVVSVKTSGNFLILEPKQFVGRIESRSFTIVIRPRFPELFEALAAANSARKLAQLQIAVGDSPEDLSDPLLAFERAGNDVLLFGIPFEFSSESIRSSRPRGRIELGKSIRLLQTRGVKHEVFSSSFRRRHPPDFCKLISTTIALIDEQRLATDSVRANLRPLETLFPATNATSVSSAIAIAPRLEGEFVDRPDVQKLIEYAWQSCRRPTQNWSSLNPNSDFVHRLSTWIDYGKPPSTQGLRSRQAECQQMA